MRQVSQEGIELIKRFEGLETQSYKDIAGIWTIGYGHTGPEVGPGMSVTPAEAEDLLQRDLERFERGVANGVDVTITQSQFDALVSLSYNIGVSAFSRSTALKRLNSGDFAGAAEAITWWNKATVNGKKRPVLGLTRRRAAEAALFLQDVHDDDIKGGGVVVEENSPRRRNPMNSRTVGGATTAGAAGAAGAGAIIMGDRAPGADEAGETPDDLVVRDDGTTPRIETPDNETPGSETNGGGGDGTDATSEAASDTPLPDQSADVGGPAPEEACVDRETGEIIPGATGAADAVVTEDESATDDATEDEPPELDRADLFFCAAEQASETTEQPQTPPPNERDTADAVGIGAGALAVLSALYVIGARIDDWLKFRR